MVQNDDSFEKKVDENGQTKYLIKSNLIKHKDGSLTPTKVFDILQLPLDDYHDLEFTEQEVKRMRMHVMKMKTGAQAMAPCLCSGPVKCPFRYRCPLVDRTIQTEYGNIDFHNQNLKCFPLLKQCIVEREYMEFQRAEYIKEFDIDVESPTEMGFINKLAELDLLDYRATLILANGDEKGEGVDLLKEQITGSTVTGEKLKRLELHPALELKEKLHRMREDILKSMVGTRREKYKQAQALRQSQDMDPSNLVANLRETLTRLEKDVPIDAEFTVAEEKKEE